MVHSGSWLEGMGANSYGVALYAAMYFYHDSADTRIIGVGGDCDGRTIFGLATGLPGDVYYLPY